MKHKIRFKEPERVFTLEEVISEAGDHEGLLFGFEYRGNFLKLECGWVAAFEDICEYCVHSLCNNYGTRAEREAFNNLNDIDRKCWISHEDYARLNKSKRISKKRFRVRKPKKDSSVVVFVEC